MTDRAKKITELTATATVANSDLFIVERVAANTTNAVTANNLAVYVAGKISGISNGTSNVFVTGTNGNVTIRSGSNTWTFSNTSILTLPNGATLHAGYPGTGYDPDVVALAAPQAYLASANGASWVGIDGQNGLASILVDGATGSAANWEFLRSKMTVVPGTIKAPQTTKLSNANGDVGEICWDANYIYVCTSTNTWKRAALSDY
jgi:hypothetical protein